ncbi:hypothetical protein Ddye_006841 [Dipteronia dyeriana]|uniref:EF-hand domain-containing protein n=1 Tax=Dipteronia dyeriana TaxID=168575 RepID=A0AAD9XJT9_9ROSI|nr:hypothetical protein Ddye_006841 [Dipteronia dyeriana]
MGEDKSCDKLCQRKYAKKGVPIPCTTEQLRVAFWRYDTNRDGRLSRKVLKEAFNYLGASIPGWRAHRALNHADGYISGEEVDELINYAVKLGYIVN